MTALEAGEGEGFENSRSLTGARPRRLFRPAENQSAESPARGRDAFLDCWISCEGWSRDTPAICCRCGILECHVGEYWL